MVLPRVGGSPPDEPAGRRLLPSTVEIIRGELKRQMVYRGEFVDQFFPSITARGSVEYSDVETMTRSQAEATSYSLARSVRHFERDSRKQRASGRAVSLSEGGAPTDYYEIKARQYSAALRDLCAAFGLAPKR